MDCDHTFQEYNIQKEHEAPAMGWLFRLLGEDLYPLGLYRFWNLREPISETYLSSSGPLPTKITFSISSGYFSAKRATSHAP